MKHPVPITALLLVLFLAAQIIGLSLLAIKADVQEQDGRTVVEYGDTALGERPDTQGFQSLLYILIGVGVGTGLVLLLIKFKAFGVWKIWFLVAVWFSTTIAVGVLIPTTIALLVCLGFAVWKVYWPNPLIHNLTEVFMYAGLAVLLVPIFSLLWVVVLLVIISIYDIIAVWHSKHMVVMAQAQTEKKLFAGLYIPKSEERGEAKSESKPASPLRETPPPSTPHDKKGSSASSSASAGSSVAILGGGDIAFPLIFSGVVMDWLIRQQTPKSTALYEALLISVVATVALALLFTYAKKERFYPAMPFLSAGCFLGLGLIWLLRLL